MPALSPLLGTNLNWKEGLFFKTKMSLVCHWCVQTLNKHPLKRDICKIECFIVPGPWGWESWSPLRGSSGLFPSVSPYYINDCDNYDLLPFPCFSLSLSTSLFQAEISQCLLAGDLWWSIDIFYSAPAQTLWITWPPPPSSPTMM